MPRARTRGFICLASKHRKWESDFEWQPSAFSFVGRTLHEQSQDGEQDDRRCNLSVKINKRIARCEVSIEKVPSRRYFACRLDGERMQTIVARSPRASEADERIDFVPEFTKTQVHFASQFQID